MLEKEMEFFKSQGNSSASLSLGLGYYRGIEKVLGSKEVYPDFDILDYVDISLIKRNKNIK